MRVQAFWIGDGQVDFRQLVASVDEVSAFLRQHHVVAGDAVVAVYVGGAGECDGQARARGFFVGCCESTGDGAHCSRVLFEGISHNGDHRHIVMQVNGRLACAIGACARWIGNSQVDLRQLVASVNEVSTFLSQDNVVARQAVVTISIAGTSEGDRQAFAWSLFVGRGERTGDGARSSRVLFQGVCRNGDHRYVVMQVDGRLRCVMRVQTFWIGDGQVDFRQLVTGVDEICALLGQHHVVAGDAVVAARVGGAGEGNRQTRTRGFFVSRCEGTGDGAHYSRVLFEGISHNGDHRHIVMQVNGRLACAIGACARWIGNSQVDLRQLIASVNEVSALLSQHNIVAVDGVVAICVAGTSKGNGQTFARSFFVGRGESTGNSTYCSGVFFDRGRSNCNHRHIVVQVNGRLAFASGVRARWISNSQVDLRQLVASINEVSALLGQYYVVAGDAVVAVSIAVASKGNRQTFTRRFFVGRSESTGNSTYCSGVFFDRGRSNHNYRDIVVQVNSRLAGTIGACARWISNSQIDLRQLVASVDEVSAFLRQHHIIAGDAVVAVSVAVASEGNRQTFTRGLFVGRGESTRDGACSGGVLFEGVSRDGDYRHVVMQVNGRLACAIGVRARWISNSQVDLRQLVASVNKVSTLLGQHNIVAIDGVVAICVAGTSEGNGQTFARSFFVGRSESTGDGARSGRVLFDGVSRNGDYRHVVMQVNGWLAFASGVRARWISNSQVDLRQLIASVNEVSALLSQHNIVAIDGVVAICVAGTSKGNGQTFTRRFFVGRSESTGDGARSGGVLFDGVSRNGDYRHIVMQVNGWLAFASGVRARWISNSQVDLRQLVASVNKVSTLLGQHNIVAIDGVVTIGIAGTSEGNGQTFARSFFVGRSESTGDGARSGRVLFDGVSRNGDHRHIVVQVNGRLACAIGACARWISNSQVDLRQLITSVNKVSTLLSQHNIVAVDGVVTISIAVASEGNRQTFTRRFFVGRGESTGDGARSGRVFFQSVGNNFNHRHIINQRHIRCSSSVRAALIGIRHGQINRRQFVTRVDEVRACQGQHHGVANEGVVAIFVAVAGEGDFQVGNRGFNIADGKVTGNGAFSHGAFHQGVGHNIDHWQVVDRNHIDRQRDRLGFGRRITILRSGGNGEVYQAVGVWHRVVHQRGFAPVADVDALSVSRRSKGVARAIRNGCALRNTADYQLERLGPILVGGVGVDGGQLDRVVFQASVQHLGDADVVQHAAQGVVGVASRGLEFEFGVAISRHRHHEGVGLHANDGGIQGADFDAAPEYIDDRVVLGASTRRVIDRDGIRRTAFSLDDGVQAGVVAGVFLKLDDLAVARGLDAIDAALADFDLAVAVTGQPWGARRGAVAGGVVGISNGNRAPRTVKVRAVEVDRADDAATEQAQVRGIGHRGDGHGGRGFDAGFTGIVDRSEGERGVAAPVCGWREVDRCLAVSARRHRITDLEFAGQGGIAVQLAVFRQGGDDEVGDAAVHIGAAQDDRGRMVFVSTCGARGCRRCIVEQLDGDLASGGTGFRLLTGEVTAADVGDVDGHSAISADRVVARGLEGDRFNQLDEVGGTAAGCRVAGQGVDDLAIGGAAAFGDGDTRNGEGLEHVGVAEQVARHQVINSNHDLAEGFVVDVGDAQVFNQRHRTFLLDKLGAVETDNRRIVDRNHVDHGSHRRRIRLAVVHGDGQVAVGRAWVLAFAGEVHRAQDFLVLGFGRFTGQGQYAGVLVIADGDFGVADIRDQHVIGQVVDQRDLGALQRAVVDVGDGQVRRDVAAWLAFDVGVAKRVGRTVAQYRRVVDRGDHDADLAGRDFFNTGAQLFGRSLNGQVETGRRVLERRNRQGAQVPGAHVIQRVCAGRGDAMAGSAVGEHGAFRQAADFHLVGFRTVGVDKGGGNRRDLDRGVFQAMVVDVAGVIAFAILHMAVAQHHASSFQRGRTGVGRQAAVAQRHRRTVVDRHIDVVVARAVLVVVVDVEGVVTRLGRRVRRPADPAALAPGFGSNQFAAHGDCQAVVGRTGEGVALAGFQVNQTGHFGRGAFGHIAVAHIAGHARGGGAVSGLGVDHLDQRAGLGDALAVGAQLARQVAAGPGLNGQTGGHLADSQHRYIRHRVNIHSDGFGVAVGVAVGGLELQLGVITLLVAHTGAAEAVVARLVVCRAVTHVVAIEISLGEDLARRGVGFQIGRGELDPLAVDFVFDRTGRQAGEHHTWVRGVFILNAERRPGQFDRGVFVARDVVIDGGWGVVNQVDGRLAFAVGACALRVGDGQVDFRQLVAGVDVISALLGQDDVVAVEGVVPVGVAVAREGDGQAFAWGFFVGSGESTGDGACSGGVFFQGVGNDFNNRHIVMQVDGRLTFAIGACARWIGNGQVDFRQLVASVNVVSAFLGQDNIVAVDGVVAVGVAVASEGNGQAFARRFFVGRGESTGDGACSGRVLFQCIRDDFNHRHVVMQVDGRLAGTSGVRARWISNSQVDFRQLVASVNVVSAFLGQDDVVAVEGVVAVGIAVARERDRQAFTWGFFVGRGESTGDGADCGGVFFDRSRSNFNHRHVVVQVDGRLARTSGVRARWISNSQVDFRQLVASVNVVSAFLGQDDVVAVEGVVAVGIAVARERDRQAFTWGFFVGRGESAGDGADCGGILFQGIGDDFNHWHIVVQVDVRLATVAGVRALRIGDGQVDFWQLIASVNKVSAFLGQHNIVAVDGVVAVGVAVACERDRQAFTWGFFVGRGESSGDGADCCRVLFQGVGDDFNHRHVVVQVDGRLAGISGVGARWISNSQVDFRQLVASVNVVGTFLGQHNVVAVDGVVAVGVAVASKGNRQAFTRRFFVSRSERPGNSARSGRVLFQRIGDDFNHWNIVVQVDGRLAGTS